MSRRRRRNPDVNWLLWGALAVGAYLLWKKFTSVASSAANAIAAPIANAFVDLTSPAAPVPQGSVILPDGTSFPAANLTNLNFGFNQGVAQFTYQGGTYSLSPHDANGNYVATRL
jgi:hypothetical protein